MANIWSRTTLRVHFACLPQTCVYPMLSVSQHDQHPHTLWSEGSACFLPESPLSCQVGTRQSRWMQDLSPTEKGKVEMKKGAEGGNRELGWVWGYHGRGACRPHVHIWLQQGPSTPEPRPAFSHGLPWVTPGPETPIPLSHHIKITGHELVPPGGSARGASPPIFSLKLSSLAQSSKQ